MALEKASCKPRDLSFSTCGLFVYLFLKSVIAAPIILALGRWRQEDVWGLITVSIATIGSVKERKIERKEREEGGGREKKGRKKGK